MDLLSDLITDHVFLFPSLRLAEQVSMAGTRTWVYEFDWSPPHSAFGACHCIELPFAFGNPEARRRRSRQPYRRRCGLRGRRSSRTESRRLGPHGRRTPARPGRRCSSVHSWEWPGTQPESPGAEGPHARQRRRKPALRTASEPRCMPPSGCAHRKSNADPHRGWLPERIPALSCGNEASRTSRSVPTRGAWRQTPALCYWSIKGGYVPVIRHVGEQRHAGVCRSAARRDVSPCVA